MLAQDLKNRNVKSTLIGEEEYFDVKDIKENHSDLKVDIKKVLLVGANIYITAENIQEVTDFDKVFKGLFKTKN